MQLTVQVSRGLLVALHANSTTTKDEPFGVKGNVN